jgi:hypothetical protein
MLMKLCCNMISTHKGMPKICQKCPLEVIAIVLFLRQQSSIPAASKVLLQPTVSLGVGIFCENVSKSHANGEGST